MANGSEVKDFKPDRQMEVTDQMVEAGALCLGTELGSRVPNYWPQGQEIARRVFLAMLEHHPTALDAEIGKAQS